MRGAADVAMAVDAGADAIGAVLVPRSRRYVDAATLRAISTSTPALIAKVAVIGADTPPHLIDAARALGFVLQIGDDVAHPQLLADGRPHTRVIGVDEHGVFERDAVEAIVADRLATLMFDTKVSGGSGGTGRTFPWQVVAGYAREHRVVIAGGLDANNVGACIAAAHPFAVDVASGIESDGRKDPARMRAFIAAVRAPELALLVPLRERDARDAERR